LKIKVIFNIVFNSLAYPKKRGKHFNYGSLKCFGNLVREFIVIVYFGMGAASDI
jgi:hypothetical protein